MAITWTKPYKIRINGKWNTLTVSKWFNPYYYKNKSDHTTLLRFSHKKSGLYFIRSKTTKKIIYIGYSSNHLYYTLYRHFEQWTMKFQEPVTFSRKTVQVRVLFCDKHHISRLEQYFIKKYKPVKNKLLYEDSNSMQLSNIPKLEQDLPF